MIAIHTGSLTAKEKFLENSDVSHIVCACRELQEHFNSDMKTTLWLNTPNPMFGGLIPMTLILLGKGNKVLKIIRNLKEENTP